MRARTLAAMASCSRRRGTGRFRALAAPVRDYVLDNALFYTTMVGVPPLTIRLGRAEGGIRCPFQSDWHCILGVLASWRETYESCHDGECDRQRDRGCRFSDPHHPRTRIVGIGLPCSAGL